MDAVQPQCPRERANTRSLADWFIREGMVPEEMFGRTRFPRIGELPYLLTFAPRGFYWFQLRKEDQE